MKPQFKTLVASLTIIVVLAGCKSNHSLLKCPDLALAKHHKTLFARNQHHNERPVSSQENANNSGNSSQEKGTLIAAAGNMPINVKLPPLLVRNISSDEDVQAVNKLINDYSDNNVGIQRKANGKLYLEAKSGKDLVSLTRNLMHPRGYYEKRYGEGAVNREGIAIAGGILGTIAFIFAWIPFLNLLAPILGIIAIIFGAIGLNSHRRGHAIAGLVLGILALFIAALTISLFTAGIGFIFI